ncbi:hypothetical protein [Amycolatopsis sp. MEPSY49]|uniref:hypothetical protein n=1 Tax=Amycolatopsis sp. MEPSY49 TaxID=3151600 RepID=UPI003EF26B03
MNLDWGSVPAWLTGAGSVAALFFAAGAARAAVRSSKAQAKQLDKLEREAEIRAQDQKREQANQIAAWVVLDEEALPSVQCINASGRPVYNVTLTCHMDTHTVSCLYAVKKPDNESKQLNYATRKIREYSSMILEAGTWGDLYRQGHLKVSIKFLDISGAWWQRDENGRLHELVNDDISSPGPSGSITH